MGDTFKIKEPVRIRFKEIAGGVKSIYLDCYLEGKRQRKFLKLYINPQKDKATKEANAIALETANKAKAEILLQMAKCGGDMLQNFSKRKETLFEYVEQYVNKRNGSRKENLKALLGLLKEYTAGKDVRLDKIDKGFIKGFINYLKERGNKNSTIAERVRQLKGVFNSAKREGIVGANQFDKFSRADLPKVEQSQRQYLTAEELQLFASADMLLNTKTIYLFSCYTGLRYSDIKALKWGNIIEENGRWFVEVRQTKTKGIVKNALIGKAVELLVEQKALCVAKNQPVGKKDVVFFNVVACACTNRAVRKIAQSVGITKHLTFHTARHTFATLLCTSGVDLYAVSKLLGHSNITTTQIYAKMVDEKKIEAIDKLNGLI